MKVGVPAPLYGRRHTAKLGVPAPGGAVTAVTGPGSTWCGTTDPGPDGPGMNGGLGAVADQLSAGVAARYPGARRGTVFSCGRTRSRAGAPPADTSGCARGPG